MAYYRERHGRCQATVRLPDGKRSKTFDSRSQAEAWAAKISGEKPVAGGTISAPDETRRKLKGKRFVFTSAQNNTFLHDQFFNALENFCEDKGAKLCVSRFTYNKNGWAYHGGITKKPTDEDVELWYDPRIEPYIVDEQVKIADGLVFCGELDILPTASMPLNTLTSYTGPNSGIIPHAKMQMRSLPTMKQQDAKFLYTTGACTQRNYIERKAGQVATFHHVFGALYVEVSDSGEWFARQLWADDTGAFYDLDTVYCDAGIIDAEDCEAVVTLGDIHAEKLDELAWNTACDMMQTVRPGHVFVHDLIDFEPRNHHNIKDPFFMADQTYNGLNRVERGMRLGALFLGSLCTAVPFASIYVVRSNHDEAFVRWLKDKDGVHDPVNARYWHKYNAIMLEAIEDDNDGFDIFAAAIKDQAKVLKIDISNVRFLQVDESCVIHGIENGMHGHYGPNGARGNHRAFRSIGAKTNTAHEHSAGLLDGQAVAGLLARLDMGYNKGPSSWSQSNIITYKNGKRAILTQRGPEWRA